MAKVIKLKGALDRYSDAQLLTLPTGEHSDQPGKGFILDVAPNGSRSWVYKFKVAGKTERMSFGSLLARPDRHAARQWHAEQFAARAAGRNPAAEMRDAVIEQAKAEKSGITFKEAAAAWIADSQQSGCWRVGSRSEDNVLRSLENHVYPKIGDTAMIALTEADVLDVLRPIWHAKKTIGEKMRQRLASIFRHCFANNKDIRKAWEGLNPADLDHVEAGLRPKKDYEVRHHPSMPYARVPAFMVKLRERNATSAKALEMTILSTLRVNSVAEGKWSELPADWRTHKIWVIPGERMKSGKPYTLTLTPRMIEILAGQEQQREVGNDHIFPGQNVGDSLADQSLLQYLQEGMNEPDCTVHGFRSSFRNWAFEVGRDNDGMRFVREIPELALTHKIGDETEMSYLTAEGRDLKRECLTAWSNYCAGTPAPAAAAAADNVVTLPRKRAGAR